MRAQLREAAGRGRADARKLLACPESVHGLALADFGAGGVGEAAIRRLLHALRVPPALVGVARAVVRARQSARLLEAAQRYAYWHGARHTLDRDTWRRLTRGTAILMYHAFGRGDEPAGRFVVPAKRFERQLGAVRRGRRAVIGLAQLARETRAGRLPPPGAVVITIDDGYADNLDVAAPLLRRFGAPATVFAVSDRVGGTADWNGAGELGSRPLLDWQGLAELSRDGFEIGAHTRTHPRLPELAPDEVDDEVTGSRETLAKRLDIAVETFAYPYGRVDGDVVASVARAGFGCACGIRRGLNYPGTPLHELRRVPVDGDVSMLRFALGLRFGDPDLLATALRRVRGAIRLRGGSG